MSYKLYTYKNLAEFRQYQKNESRSISPFVFVETKELLETAPDSIIDITALIYYLQSNPGDAYPAYINLLSMTEKSTIIIHEQVSISALELFPHIFETTENLFDEQQSDELIKQPSEYKIKFNLPKQTIYTYDNEDILNEITDLCFKEDIPIASFPRASGALSSNYNKFNTELSLAIIDLTSMSYAIDDNKNIIYLAEQFFGEYNNIKFIVMTKKADIILKYFPLYFQDQERIKKLLPNLSISENTKSLKNSDLKYRIVDLQPSEIETLLFNFNNELIGHNNFKLTFSKLIKNFVHLNKIKEQKVFSVFLFGSSGIGKTEVARILNNQLHQNSYLSKINFQNYSSQDALNSLIGSPAGYIGYGHGELSEKINKGNVGILLCDEFEKTNRPVFSFFLELLEDGKFTDSMSREFELDGYIIIFTSNLENKEDYEKLIPPELQTRIDLVCEFEEPSSEEKHQFLESLLNKAKVNFSEEFSKFEFTQNNKVELLDFDISSIHSLRDIKRIFNYRLMDLFYSKIK